ncbi:MAG: hypothetical protein WCS43_08905 [Verrucomicrobiota bacterium]
MNKTLLALTSTLMALVLPGCFQSETTIHLNKDGSGTLVEETRFGAQMLAMIGQMGAIGGDEKAAKPDPMKDLMSEEKAKTHATTLGEGVTFVKAEPSEVGGAKGARVTYAFKDINKLKISAGDSMNALSSMPGAKAEVDKKAEPMVFNYAGGNLSIKMPQPKKPDAPDAGAADAKKPDMDSPEAMAMMKQMCGDMKMSLKLVVEPGIGETNATHRDGSTITLMEMNMGKLVESADAMKKLGKIDPKQDPSVAMDALKGIDGIKVETQKEVTVTVK